MESKKIIEALMVGGVLVISGANHLAFAANTQVCNEGTASSVASGSFIKQAFTPKCSANVTVNINDVDATVAAVAGMSKKGAHMYGGSTEGGKVEACSSGSSMSYTAPVAGSAGCPNAQASTTS